MFGYIGGSVMDMNVGLEARFVIKCAHVGEVGACRGEVASRGLVWVHIGAETCIRGSSSHPSR